MFVVCWVGMGLILERFEVVGKGCVSEFVGCRSSCSKGGKRNGLK